VINLAFERYGNLFLTSSTVRDEQQETKND